MPNKLAYLAVPYLFLVFFASGDPRGNTLKIEVKSGYSNSFGGECICVPTS